MTGNTVRVSADHARGYTRALFVAAGTDDNAAALVAEGLVEADLQGVGSHGLLQAPNYLRRIMAGTISRGASLRRVHARGAINVFDAGLALGHAVARQAMEQAVALAATHGIAAVAVRAATHFGIAGRHARVAAEAGSIGIAMCNSRAMLPAPGGAHGHVEHDRRAASRRDGQDKARRAAR
jgi:LDH2 family malate/lactate/ureidoglycolate dehydrogenase